VFRIRDFSRLTRVSIKTLRHYDRIGLLPPAHVDPRSRYRYYRAGQVTRLQSILALRDLGFSLEHIGALLAGGSRAQTKRLFAARRAVVQQQLELERRRLSQLDATLRELEGRARSKALDVALRTLPAVRVAARRARVANLDAGAERLFEAVEQDAARAGVRASAPPILIYHDRDHRESRADIEACVPVMGDARNAGRSTIRTLPAVTTAACLVYSGGYAPWGRYSRGLLTWLQARRLVPAGSLRETFHQFQARELGPLRLPAGFLVERAEDLLTEMQIPVRRA